MPKGGIQWFCSSAGNKLARSLLKSWILLCNGEGHRPSLLGQAALGHPSCGCGPCISSVVIGFEEWLHSEGFAGARCDGKEKNSRESPASLTKEKQTNLSCCVLTFRNWHLIIYML